MKYGFSTLGLFLILFVTLHIQQAFSQEQPLFDFTPQTPTQEETLQSVIDPNTGLPEGVEEQVTFTQIPSIPKPGQNVSIQVVSYSTNLNKAVITWTLDGRNVVSQTGATTFNFNAPESGQTSRLVITIQKETGGTISKTIVVNPADVDLIYEAQTYAHPFYKGKKMFTSEAVIKFIALPNFVTSSGNKIADENLVYTWSINGTVQQNASGYGKNTFSTKGTLIERANQVSVEVSAVNSTLKASQSISFRSQQPELVLYENNPILGVVYEQAVGGTFNLERPQVDFEAIPYFFSTNFKDSSTVNFSWTLNGTKIESKNPNENYLVLRNDKNEEGRALINVVANHANNILQTTQSSLELNFSKVNNVSNEEFSF